MKRRKKTQSGLTLLELLVIIALVGIVVAVLSNVGPIVKALFEFLNQWK